MFYYSLDVFDSWFSAWNFVLRTHILFFIRAWCVCAFFDLPGIQRNIYIFLCRPLFICNTFRWFVLFIYFFIFFPLLVRLSSFRFPSLISHLLSHQVVYVCVWLNELCSRSKMKIRFHFGMQYILCFSFKSLTAHPPFTKFNSSLLGNFFFLHFCSAIRFIVSSWQI